MFPWGSLNWLNGWGSENIFGVDCWDVRKNKKGRNWWGIEEGSASEGCKNDFWTNKGGIGRWKLSKIDDQIFYGDCRGGFKHK